MLYGDCTGYSSSNPLGIQGNSIVIKAPLSSCPNGIKIHFSTSTWNAEGNTVMYQRITIRDINIPKGRSSGSSSVDTEFCPGGIINANINGTTLSFFATNYDGTHDGTVTYSNNDGSPAEMLAITSITAY